MEKAKKPNSASELLNMLVKMRVFTWQEVETLMNTKVLLMTEKFLVYPGEAKWHSELDLDLSYGEDRHSLNWTDIKLELKRRQKVWQNYHPQIPGMDAVPIVTAEQLRLIDNPQIKDHFRKSVNGKQSIVQIAEKLDRDPLKIAKNYHNWRNNGWMSFISSPTKTQIEAKPEIQSALTSSPVAELPNNNLATRAQVEESHLPIVLSVDDSAIIQTTIKRALQADYNVLLAQKAEEALKILHEVEVELMLLDLTMPDVDGLEFCKTIRAIPKFQNLPIVMVTARDGLVNKMKGHFAGTDKYLTKPFKADELQKVVYQYIK
ncbi:MAG: response regulator, partial [Cyanobacteria bacterium J06600_6]